MAFEPRHTGTDSTFFIVIDVESLCPIVTTPDWDKGRLSPIYDPKILNKESNEQSRDRLIDGGIAISWLIALLCPVVLGGYGRYYKNASFIVFLLPQRSHFRYGRRNTTTSTLLVRAHTVGSTVGPSGKRFISTEEIC